MKKVLLVVLVLVVGIGVGLGSAYLVGSALYRNSSQPVTETELVQPPDGFQQPFGRGGMGMMNRYGRNSVQPGSTDRISLDEAVAIAQDAVENGNSQLVVKEVMEFSDNFYVLVVEKDTGRGAYELLIDPYTGALSGEPGPNMMWNLKYGHHRTADASAENIITLEQAGELAQKALDEQGAGATVEGMGTSFYGYYTFDTQVDGKINGMLSVNGTSGQVWIHTWHGTFISEKEISE